MSTRTSPRSTVYSGGLSSKMDAPKDMSAGSDRGPVRVAIVDDDPGIVKVISVILKTNGFEVVNALSGAGAIDMIRAEQPDVVLLDIMMPDIDGFEVCRQIKGDPATKDIPVIFVSAKTGMDHMDKGMELGAAGYIIKPFIPAALIAKIKETTDRSG